MATQLSKAQTFKAILVYFLKERKHAQWSQAEALKKWKKTTGTAFSGNIKQMHNIPARSDVPTKPSDVKTSKIYVCVNSVNYEQHQIKKVQKKIVRAC